MASKKDLNLEDETFEFVVDQQPQPQQEEKPHKKTSHTHQASHSEDKKCPNCENNLAKAEEYKNLLQLTQADFDNYRKRSYSLLQNAKTDGELNVIMKFLPALDSFVKAKSMISDPNILKGVEMIEKQIKDSLKGIGVKEMNPKGEMFDPNYHHAISALNNPEFENDTILEVYQNGYLYNDKVIRYAQVIINKKGE